MEGYIPDYFLWEVLAGICIMVISFGLLSLWKRFTRKQSVDVVGSVDSNEKSRHTHSEEVLHAYKQGKEDASEEQKKKRGLPFIFKAMFFTSILLVVLIISKLLRIPTNFALALLFIVALFITWKRLD